MNLQKIRELEMKPNFLQRTSKAQGIPMSTDDRYSQIVNIKNEGRNWPSSWRMISAP